MVQLPIDLYEPTAATAEPGQVFWVTPWSLHVDRDANVWLTAAALRLDECTTTACVRVVRRADGVAVDLGTLYASRHRWTPGDTARCGNGVDTTELWPVVEWTDPVG